MPVIASGNPISMSGIRTELGLTGSQTIGNVYREMFGVPIASQSAVPFSRFYGAFNPKKVVHMDAATLTGVAGSTVSSWAGSNTMPSATGAGTTLPLLQTTGGKYVNFDRTKSQYFSLSPSITFTLQDASTNPINGISILMVARRSATAGSWERFFDFGGGTGSDNIVVARPSTTANITVVQIYNGSTNSFSRSITMTDGIFHVFAFTFENKTTPTYRFYLNGTEVTSSVQTISTVSPLNSRNISSNFIARSNWGGDSYFSGDMRELIVLNNALSADQVTYWSNYLKTKWGI